MTDSPKGTNWEARKNAVNAVKAAWLDNNADHLKLIQYCLTCYWDEYLESQDGNAAENFMSQADDAIRSLISLIVDLRRQDFIKQAKTNAPEAFNDN